MELVTDDGEFSSFFVGLVLMLVAVCGRRQRLRDDGWSGDRDVDKNISPQNHRLHQLALWGLSYGVGPPRKTN